MNIKAKFWKGHSRNEIENGNKPQALLCVQPPVQIIPRKMLLIFSPVLFTSYCRFHCSYFPYFLFFIFHFLQHNQHIIFFEGNFTRVISCLSSKIDHFQGRSIGQSIFNFAMSWGKKVTAIPRRLSIKGLGIPRKLDWIGPNSRFHRHDFKTRHNFKRNLQCCYHNMLLLLAQSIRAWICVARRMGSWRSLIMGSGGLYQDNQSGSFLLTESLLSLVNFIC